MGKLIITFTTRQVFDLTEPNSKHFISRTAMAH